MGLAPNTLPPALAFSAGVRTDGKTDWGVLGANIAIAIDPLAEVEANGAGEAEGEGGNW